MANRKIGQIILTQQWISVAERITRSFCMANRTTGQILNGWYGNSQTKRIASVGYTIELDKIQCEY